GDRGAAGVPASEHCEADAEAWYARQSALQDRRHRAGPYLLEASDALVDCITSKRCLLQSCCAVVVANDTNLERFPHQTLQRKCVGCGIHAEMFHHASEGFQGLLRLLGIVEAAV